MSTGVYRSAWRPPPRRRWLPPTRVHPSGQADLDVTLDHPLATRSAIRIVMAITLTADADGAVTYTPASTVHGVRGNR